jgi:hypothetical protein
MKEHASNPETPLPDLPTVVLSGTPSGNPERESASEPE